MVAKAHPNITSLYKYRAFNKYSLEGLRDKKLWASRPNSFTDPFDCNTDNYDPNKIKPRTIDILVKGGLDDIDWENPSNILKLNMIRHAEFVKWAQKSGVLCLTENCESILMWSHYADGHQGFCMEFERTENSELDDLETPRPVSYSPDCPNIDLDEQWRLTDVEAFRRELCKLVFVKAEGWKYEMEWRCFYEEGNRLVDYPGKLKAVIWGMHTSEASKNAIKDLLKNHTVIFKQAKRVLRAFSVAIEAAPV